MGQQVRAERLLLVAFAVLFAAAACVAPVNHDESQYVAAVALMRDGVPYRDWAYLQTPLQPLLFAPLSFVKGGWLLVTVRAANAILAVATCGLMLHVLSGRVPFWAAAAAVTGMATTNAFLFAAAVARNDMLPVTLLAGALALLLPRGAELSRNRAALGGLCLGLAISAKISLVLPVAGAGLWFLWRWNQAGGAPRLAAAAIGGLAGLLPCIVLAAIAPDQFRFEVFDYNLEAPQQFWLAAGSADLLAPSTKLKMIAVETLNGAIAVALLLCLANLRQRSAEGLLLELMIVGGLLAAFLPDPFFEQYLAPLHPPLFARAALALPVLGRLGRGLTLAGGIVTAGVGASDTASDAAQALNSRSELALAVEQGRVVAEAAAGRPVATLAGERVAGADVQLQPGFAAGPFLFRTSGDLAARAARLGRAPTWQRPDMLDADPPAVLVTGGERKPRPPGFPQGVDAHLDLWAARRGYQRVQLPGNNWLMWVAPTQKGGHAGPPSSRRSDKARN